ncbi:alginate lyase family protein [Pontiellaceae bacterium B1224]|nr:alginate lyase family protein [Pontiellaceae bacterium B1224]
MRLTRSMFLLLAMGVLWGVNRAAIGETEEREFVHPGILHTKEDMLRIRENVAAGKQPYLAGFEVLKNHPQSSSDYEVKGGFKETGRKPSVRSSEHESDANAAYQNAMMWVITGDRAYADKSIEIINAWSGKLKEISGKDAILSAGISGVKFVAAAEVLRYTNSGWSEMDILRAEKMFTDVYYPVCENMADFANGNWALAALQTVMAIAVFTDDQAMFDRAVDWFYNGKDNARLTNYVINEAGQCQESGRDQQHTMLGLGYLSVVAEIGWNQGLDLYGAENNRILAGFEYTASYNLGNEVPFEETTDTTGKYHHTKISEEGRGDFSRRPIFEMVYHHYKVRQGIDCPFTEEVVMKMRPEGPGFKGDHFGFGTVLFAEPE